MTGRSILLLGLLALSITLVWGGDSSEETVAEPEVECSRMMCRMFCPRGFVHDKYGCPKCECLEEMPCPMPMCANDCPGGYSTNEHGCMMCTCKEEVSEEDEGLDVEGLGGFSPMDPLCDNHPCPDNHQCVAVKPPMCELLGHGMCDKRPMCLPDAHGGMFLPHLAEDHVPGEFGPIPELTDVPDMLGSICKFKQGFSKQLAQEAKAKYANSSILGRLLQHNAMHSPWCDDDGQFRPLQCHAPDKMCWCVNDRGQQVDGSRAQIKSKADVPKCVEHVTQKIEGMFLLQHSLDDVESQFPQIASVLTDHLATWLKIDHAQINIKQVSQTEGGLLEVHFELARSDENELHSAELMLSWHMGHKKCKVPFADSELIPVHSSLKLQHHTSMVDEDGVIVDLPDHGLYSREMKQQRESKHDCWFTRLYRRNKALVISGCVAAFFFIIVVIGVIVTLCKRARMRSSQFQHQRMCQKSKTYKENLAFANDLYGVKQEKPGFEAEKPEEKAEEKPEEKPEEATDA